MSGVDVTMCTRCRQSERLGTLLREPGTESRLLVPLMALIVAIGLVLGGFWISRSDVEPVDQDALPATESPSR